MFYIVVHSTVYEVTCSAVRVHNIMTIPIMGEDRISRTFCNLLPNLGQCWDQVSACSDYKKLLFAENEIEIAQFAVFKYDTLGCLNCFGSSTEHFPERRVCHTPGGVMSV